MAWEVDESVEVRIGDTAVLKEGTYQIDVPPGQRAVVTYELDVAGEDEDE